MRCSTEKGLINLVLLAITLPILILLGAAGGSIIQLPLVKQQMNRAIAQTFHEFTFQNGGETQVGSAMNWCIINVGAGGGCPSCTCLPSSCTCSGAKEATARANSMASNYLLALQRELVRGGANQFGVGATKHPAANVFIEVSIRNMLVDRQDGAIIGFEDVANDIASNYGAMLPNPGDDSDQLFLDKFALGDVNFATVTSQLATGSMQDRIHVPVVLTHIAIKVDHAFKLPTGLRYGIQSSADYSVLDLVSFRTLSRTYRPSGPSLTAVPVLPVP